MIISINTLYFNLCIHDTFKRIFAQCQVYIHVYRFIKNYVINQKKIFLTNIIQPFSNYISFILPTPCQWLYKGLKWKQTLFNLFINFSMILQTTYIYVFHRATNLTLSMQTSLIDPTNIFSPIQQRIFDDHIKTLLPILHRGRTMYFAEIHV